MKELTTTLLAATWRLRRPLAFVTLFVLAASSVLIAQDPVYDPIDPAKLTPENIFSTVIEPLYGGLIIVFGYISAYIPGIKKLSPFYRVLTFALAAGLGFYLFGAGFWKVTATYFISSGLYAVILKHLFPSPKAAING